MRNALVSELLTSAHSVGQRRRGSLRRAYGCDVASLLTTEETPPAVTEADLGPLPELVRRYLRAARVVGHPHVRNVRTRMHGRIRSGPSSRWMTFVAEQHNVFGGHKARMFYMDASMFGIPLQGYHRYVDRAATMEIRALGIIPVQKASGEEMTRAETVTLFNDMCVMAPATLVDPVIRWETIDARTVRAEFMNAGQTIRAELTINGIGELVDFVSDDRTRTSPGHDAERVRWSTPLSRYRQFDTVRLASYGEGVWHAVDGKYAYIELTIDDVAYNVKVGERER